MTNREQVTAPGQLTDDEIFSSPQGIRLIRLLAEQTNSICVFLGGFSFAGLLLLLGMPPTPYLYVVFVSMTATTLLLIGSVVYGAFIRGFLIDEWALT
jgi:hypothetical protein